MLKRFLAWAAVRLAWVAVLLLIAAAVVFGVPGSRYVVLGYLNNEPFYDNMPRTYYVQALKSPDTKTRRHAAFALGVLGPEGRGTVSGLIAALDDDKDPLVRINAALALYKFGPGAREALPAIIRALRDEVDLVRMDAAMSLARLGPDAREAVPALIEALPRKENRTQVLPFPRSIREQMVVALGKIGPDAHAAVPALTAALTDEQVSMRTSAAEALQRIDPAPPDPVPPAGSD
jgi:HEAT repeat protein